MNEKEKERRAEFIGMMLAFLAAVLIMVGIGIAISRADVEAKAEADRTEAADRASFEKIFNVPAYLPPVLPSEGSGTDEAHRVRDNKVVWKLASKALILAELSKQLADLRADNQLSYTDNLAKIQVVKDRIKQSGEQFFEWIRLSNRFCRQPITDCNGIFWGESRSSESIDWQQVAEQLQKRGC